MITAFPDFPGGPRSSSPSAVFDGHPLPGRGVLRDQHGNVVDDWPDDKPIPSGWMVSRRLTAMDSAAGVLGGAALNLEETFLALPRGLQRRRHQIEVDISSASDAFERGAALRLAEVTIRELLNIADLAEKGGSVPWDAGVSDPGILAQAARAAADYLRGFSNSALRMMSPASAPNGLAAAGDRAVSDQDRAFDAHSRMVSDIGSAWRTGGFAAPAPAAAPAWGGSFGGAPVSDQDAAASAHAEMKRSISDAWRSGR